MVVIIIEQELCPFVNTVGCHNCLYCRSKQFSTKYISQMPQSSQALGLFIVASLPQIPLFFSALFGTIVQYYCQRAGQT